MKPGASLRILFLEPRPDLRCVALGALLRGRGQHVELACSPGGEAACLADGFARVRVLDDLARPGDLARDFDLLVCAAPETARAWNLPAVSMADAPQGLLRAHLPVKLSPRDSRDGRLRAAVLAGFGPLDAAALREQVVRLLDLDLAVNVYFWRGQDQAEALVRGLDRVACHRPESLREFVSGLSRNDLGLVLGGPAQDAGPSAEAALFLAAGLPLLVRADLPDAAFLRRVPAGALLDGPESVQACIQAGQRFEIRNFAPLLDPLAQDLERRCRRAAGSEAAAHRGGTVNARALALDGRDQTAATPDLEEISLRARRAMVLATAPGRSVPPQAVEALAALTATGVRDAVELGCGGSPAASRLLEQGLMLLGLDLADLPSAPGLRALSAPFWEIPAPADLVYALDLLHFLSEDQIRRTLDAAAQRAPLFFASLAASPRDTLEAECLETARPGPWWHRELLERFVQVDADRAGEGHWLACRRDGLAPEVQSGRMRGYRSWNEVTGLPVTHYREHWNRHARSLPWTGRLLYIGSNPLCRSYYHAAFFQVDEVLHVDPDPGNGADLVTVGEDLRALADGSVDGVAFFGTPYVMNDPAAFVAEARRVLKPGGILSGAFNGPASRWEGRPYACGAVKAAGEQWIFELGPVLDLFAQGFDLRTTARMGQEYFFVTATKERLP